MTSFEKKRPAEIHKNFQAATHTKPNTHTQTHTRLQRTDKYTGTNTHKQNFPTDADEMLDDSARRNKITPYF